ncbi:hypothetical protein HH310_19920 [Actinoplanes sp. TBRC 11911]|uniref:hypothetical protein n=1 Tax=Actinoplanes sp. TBRC 11911 TaxID=2729386 RepID=UPI00145EF879|nr:hypothetical protein [Actinoplanes sp. TBRC 11911]NMO53444.1 hypothetical protein [Actinoplanes sp. TBRC 11911]
MDAADLAREEPRGTGKRSEISETVKRALYAMSNGTCYAPGCVQPAFLETGAGGPRMNVEVAHIYGVKRNAPRFRDDLTDRERDDWRHLLLLCKAHHNAVDDPTSGARLYPAETLLTWKNDKEIAIFGVLTGSVTQDSMERMLAKYFEDPSERLASLIDRLETVVDEADSTGRISSSAVQELRLVVSMLAETDAYRLAASARALNEAADIYASLKLKETATALSDAATHLSTLKLGDKARLLRAAADEVSHSTRRPPEY